MGRPLPEVVASYCLSVTSVPLGHYIASSAADASVVRREDERRGMAPHEGARAAPSPHAPSDDRPDSGGSDAEVELRAAVSNSYELDATFHTLTLNLGGHPERGSWRPLELGAARPPFGRK